VALLGAMDGSPPWLLAPGEADDAPPPPHAASVNVAATANSQPAQLLPDNSNLTMASPCLFIDPP